MKKLKIGKVYKFWIALLAFVGGCSLLYFFLILLMAGGGLSFNYFWLGLAMLCGGLSALVYRFARLGEIPPKWVTVPVECIVGIGFFLFIVTEAVIVFSSHGKATENADVLIVLGAKVNGTHPSLILKYRIDAAVDYLRRNPDTRVIASGGKGNDEGISEAQCIYSGLVEQGIAPERIIMEDTSTSTRENLILSSEYIDPEHDSVVITTTDFHLFRAVRLAKRCGYRNVSGNSAKSVWWLIPTNYTREFFAIMKALVTGEL